MERASDGCGCLAVLPRSQDGDDLSREEFRDNLRWRFDLPLHNLPLTCNGCNNLVAVYHVFRCNRERGGEVRSSK